MKPKTAIILTALLVVCIAFALFRGDLFTSSKPEEQGREQKLFDPAPGKCVELTIEGKAGKMTFKKVDDDWRIVEPIRAKAENWPVNDVADAFKDLKGRPAGDVGSETTGLDEPLWKVTVVDDKKASYCLLVGRPRPMQSGQTYVRPAKGKQDFIVEVDFAYKLNKPLSDFRDKTVLDLKTDKIARLEIVGQRSYELVRKDDKWGIVKPISAEADKDKVKDLLDDAARVTASEFVADAPEDLAAYGLTQPRLVVRIEMEPEEPTTTPATTQAAPKPKPGKKHGLALGKHVGEKIYAKLLDEPAVFKVDESKLEDLQPKLVDLRVKKVLRLAAADVTGVEVELPAGKAALAKKDGQWEMTAPLKGKADEDTVKKLLDGAADLKADSFKDSVAVLKTYGLDSPKARLTFRLAGKGETTTLLIGGETPSGEMTFVKSAAGLAVAVVKTDDLKDLLAEPATYWDRTLLKLADGEKTVRMQLRRIDETFTLARDANDDWSLSTPLAASADADQVNKVIDHLEDLSADKIVYLGKQVPESFSGAKEIMQLVVTTERTPKPPEPATKPTTQPTTEPTTQATRPAATKPAATKPAATKPAATKPAATKPATTKPAPKPIVKTYNVVVAKVSLHAYAWVPGGKIVSVGEFAPSLYDDLAGELRSRKIWEIDPDKVRSISLTAGKDSLELKKDDKAWTYTADQYVKIDAEKVESFLKDIKEPSAKKFVTHKAPTDLSKYGLDKPWLKLELTDEKGAKSALALSHAGATKTEDRYGTASTVQGVFELEASTIEKMTKTLKDFRK